MAKTVSLTVPETLRAHCAVPTGQDQVRTVGDLTAFSLRQDAAIKDCDGKRQALVSIIDGAKPKKRWWAF